ncbi:MAG: Npt1/Npt2 family nucleotide transporter [bacterium]|nr:Npt1/Npt2 family nucleotide transporter [bacterium]
MFRLPLARLAINERARFFYCLAGFMCIASAALIARTAGDALFLNRYSLDLLSYMYVGTAIVVVCASSAYGIFAGRVPAGRLIPRTCAVLIFFLLLLRLSLLHPWGGFRITAYLLADLVVNLPMMLFWSFAALVFNPREAKRLFGFVGAGGTLSCILAGFLVQPLAAYLGTENLLLLVALLLAGFLGIVTHLSKIESARLQPAPGPAGKARRPPLQTRYGELLKTPQVRNLVLLVVAATLTLTLVDYQFKASARLRFEGADLAGFFGKFYAYASVLALFLQLFFVHRILSRGGVLLGLAILPAALVFTSVGTLLTASFSWTIATKFVVQTLLFTIDIAALQMLYLGTPIQSRNQARTFVEGQAKPLAMAVAGLALVALSQEVPLHILAMGAAGGALIWLLLTRANHRSYVSALVGSLDTYRFDPSAETAPFHDKNFESHLREALTSVSDEDIAYLLSIVQDLDHVDWAPEFRDLLGRQNTSVKIAALSYLQEHGNQQDLNAVLAHRTHPDPGVRAAATYASAALGGEDSLEEIENGLRDPHPAVRSAAIGCLINSGDLDNLLTAGAVLKTMLAHERADERIAAAQALAHVPNESLVRPLIGLLQDLDTNVVRAALHACENRTHPRLIAAVIPLLAETELHNMAAQVLAGFGKPALDHLTPYLELRRMDGALQGAAHVPAILAEIGDPSVFPALFKAAEQAEDAAVQTQAVRACAKLLLTLQSLKPYQVQIDQIIKGEISAAKTHQADLLALSNLPGTDVLRDALKHAFDNHLENTFTLLSVLIPGVDLLAVHRNLARGSRESRANAVEILDNVLKGETKTSILALLEPPRSAEGTPQQAAARILELAQNPPTDWVLIGALYAAAENAIRNIHHCIPACLEHPHAVVRETGLYTLARFEDPTLFQATCAGLLEDPDAAVRRLAEELSNPTRST